MSTNGLPRVRSLLYLNSPRQESEINLSSTLSANNPTTTTTTTTTNNATTTTNNNSTTSNNTTNTITATNNAPNRSSIRSDTNETSPSPGRMNSLGSPSVTKTGNMFPFLSNNNSASDETIENNYNNINNNYSNNSNNSSNNNINNNINNNNNNNNNNNVNHNSFLSKLLNGDSSAPLSNAQLKINNTMSNNSSSELAPDNSKVNSHVHTLHYHIDSVLCLDTCYIYENVEEQNQNQNSNSNSNLNPNQNSNQNSNQNQNPNQKQKLNLTGEEKSKNESFSKNNNMKATERKCYIFTGSQDCKIGVWDISTFQLVGTLIGHSRSVLKLRALPRRRHPLLFSSGRDNCICVWDINSLSLIIRFSGFNACVYDMTILTFPKDGGYFLYGGCQDTSIFQLELAKTITLPETSKEHIATEDIEHLHTQRALLSYDPQQSYRSLSNDRMPRQANQNDRKATASKQPLQTNKTSQIIETAKVLEQFVGSDPKARYLSKEVASLDNKVLRIYQRCHSGLIYVLKAFSSHTLISASADASIKIWEIKVKQEPSCIATLQGHTHSIISLDLIGQKYLFSASKDCSLKVWNVNVPGMSHVVQSLSGHSREITAMKVIANGKLIVSGSRDGMVRFWDTHNYECVCAVMLSQKRSHGEQPTKKHMWNGGDKFYERQAAYWSSLGHQEDNIEMDSSSDESDNENKITSLNNTKEKKNEEKKKDIPPSTSTVTEKQYVIPELHVWNDSLLAEEDETKGATICAMDFLFVSPSWLTIADTCNKVEIWDISNILFNMALSRVHTNYLRWNERNDYIGSGIDEILLNNSKALTMEEILTELNLGEYIDRFQAEKIDTKSLLELNNEDLKALELPLGPRKKLLSYINTYNIRQQLGASPQANELEHIDENDDDSVDSSQAFGSVFHDPVQELFSDLARFVAFRSVSADPSCRDQCFQAARFFQEQCEKFGSETRFMEGLPGRNPVVLARFASNEKEHHPAIRVLVYGNYDVAPVANEERWNTPPFQLTGKNGYVYGRGATDNKGPLITYAYALSEHLKEYIETVIASRSSTIERSHISDKTTPKRKVEGENDHIDEGTKEEDEESMENLSETATMPWEVVIIADGQGQFGWKNGGLQQVIKKNLDWLDKPTLILSSTSSWLGDDVPCLVYGMRGLVSIQCEILGPHADMHAGIHGGAFNEPTMDLVHILSKLKNGSGTNNREEKNIKIPHFYDRVESVSKNEIKNLQGLSFDAQEYARQIGVSRLESNDPIESLMKRMNYPSISVNSFRTSNQQQTIISKKASAIISIRTVPKQNNTDIFDLTKKFLISEFKMLNSGNELKIELISMADHWLMDPLADYFKVAEEAIMAHWNMKPYYIRDGATSPCINYLCTTLGAPCLQLPLGQASDNAHLANERIRLENLTKGKEVIKTFLRKFFEKRSSHKKL